ncbi:UvrD-helicase domain-containing protein [uncultured Rhodoblastus sp.]|uniref:ATP-dependent helicase n=1 Tax=uncultured Rhodoblastus sp. TaxID=543037 RepID=UPI0025F679B7|nr:UvrD-helicase domain-containing protein [uncultured Rhodoblastus sp.]
MPDPDEYLPEAIDGPDWDEYQAIMANEPPQSVPDAWEALAARLTAAQREAAMHPGSTLVLAGAGTGKTSTLTASVVHKIEIQKIPASRILVVTFTNKAAAELAERIRAALDEHAAPNWLGTFHGLGARQLRATPEVAGLRKDFDILDAGDSHLLIKRVMKALNLANDVETGGGRDPVKAIANKISSFKDQLITPETAATRIDAIIAAAAHRGEQIESVVLRNAAKVYAIYQRRLREANAADFGDLLLWPTLAMQNTNEYRRQWSSRFVAVLADEYQDVNYAQYTWLKAMASHCRRLFAVGDDDQSIYGWRGADVSLIRRFTRDFPDAAEVRLEENFRSTGHILAAANAVIAGDKSRLGKTLFTNLGAGHPIALATYRDAEAEALGLAAAILVKHGEGAAWDHIAVLYRTNVLSRAFEEALMRAKIPYEIVGDVGFYARQEIKIALAYLRLATHPDDRQSDEAFRRVINEPRRGFGPQALATVEDEASFREVSLLTALETASLPPKARSEGLKFADQVRRIGADPSHSLADQISLLLDACGYRELLRASKAEEAAGRLENLEELISLASSFHSARELLDHAALATNRASEGAAPAVRLMTMHRAKGLEFDHVFLPAFENGIIPSTYGDADEERRLAYVALTRGKRHVTISWAQYRRGPSEPSPFIEDIPEDAKARVVRQSDRGGRPHLSHQKASALRALGARMRGF